MTVTGFVGSVKKFGTFYPEGVDEQLKGFNQKIKARFILLKNDCQHD
jgi:hypothetical protein